MAILTNTVDSNPFQDVVYLLGGEEQFQQVEKEGLVELDIQVYCGPLIFEFYEENNVDLDSAFFTLQDPLDNIDSEFLTFLVNQQTDELSTGEYLIKYRAYLQNHPNVSIEI